MKNGIDWSSLTDKLRDAVESESLEFPAVEKMLLEDEERRQKELRTKRQHAVATVLALVAILVSVLAGWGDITDMLNQAQKALSP